MVETYLVDLFLSIRVYKIHESLWLIFINKYKKIYPLLTNIKTFPMAKILIYIQSLSFSKEYGRFNFFGILSDFGCFLSR